MYRITSHQAADLFWPGPARLHPEKGAFTLKMGTHTYPSVPPRVLERIEVWEIDGLATIEIVDETAVAS